jgi:hypothetical protein
MATQSTPERLKDVLARTEAGRLLQDHAEDGERVQEIERLTQDANQAQHDFELASQEFHAILDQENEMLAELLRVAFRMQEAKLRATAALSGIRRTAGLI